MSPPGRGRAHGTIVVLASGSDRIAARFAHRFRRTGVRLMTPSDLTVPGWVCRLGRPSGCAVVSGVRIPTDAIRTVLTRLTIVTSADIAHLITPEDCEYAAAEMTAFLAAWLDSLNARTFNRPSPTFLPGEAQTPPLLRVYAELAALRPATKTPCATTSISCVDGRPLVPDGPLRSAAAAAAQAIPDRLVRVHLTTDGDTPRLAGYDPFVAIETRPVARAVLRACR
jgi:hypothetical protein